MQGMAQQAGPAETWEAVHQHSHSPAGQHSIQAPNGQAISTQAQQGVSRRGQEGQQGTSSQAQQGLTAPELQPGQHSAVPGACPLQEEDQLVPPEDSQQAATRHLRHCTSLHSVADGAERSQNGQDYSSARSVGCQAPQHAWPDRQHAHQEAESLNAQNMEACVASSRRLEQPTASTGTSRPVPLMHAGQCLSSAPAVWHKQRSLQCGQALMQLHPLLPVYGLTMILELQKSYTCALPYMSPVLSHAP